MIGRSKFPSVFRSVSNLVRIDTSCGCIASEGSSVRTSLLGGGGAGLSLISRIGVDVAVFAAAGLGAAGLERFRFVLFVRPPLHPRQGHVPFRLVANHRACGMNSQVDMKI